MGFLGSDEVARISLGAEGLCGNGSARRNPMAGDPRFACDAMLGGLARWLRAAGYDACWSAGIDDWDLIRLAQREDRVLLTSDSGIFRIGIVRDGDVPGLFIPPGLRTKEQLALVLRKLKLAPRAPRCMACGGALVEVGREQVRERVPARSYAWVERFFECQRCRRVLWQGTHWQRIQAVLDHILASGGRQPPDDIDQSGS
jgi:uncharacterized protein with PIN domain